MEYKDDAEREFSDSATDDWNCRPIEERRGIVEKRRIFIDYLIQEYDVKEALGEIPKRKITGLINAQQEIAKEKKAKEQKQMRIFQELKRL